jgi:hypothetical protein
LKVGAVKIDSDRRETRNGLVAEGRYMAGQVVSDESKDGRLRENPESGYCYEAILRVLTDFDFPGLP